LRNTTLAGQANIFGPHRHNYPKLGRNDIQALRAVLANPHHLKHVERHGPLSSTYLHALTKDTHRCRDTSLRQLQKLRAGGFLLLPHQQRFTEHADFNPYIYDLTKQARDHLIDLGLAESTVRPTGHWGHGAVVSSVTSAIDIAAARNGVRYIPAHKILAIKQAPLAVCIGGRKLIPDQLFALDYGGMYRAVVLEVDRGTEPKTSSAARKSYVSSIELYRQMIEHNLHRAHYGLKATMLILWVFTRRSNEQRFLEMVGQIGGQAKGLICTQVMPDTRATLKAVTWANFKYWRAWRSTVQLFPRAICQDRANSL